MCRFRDCHQIERLTIYSDGGIGIRFRDPRPDYAHSSRSAVAHVGSMGPTTPRARPVLSPRQVKKRKRAANHQAALAAVAASRSWSRSASSKTNGAPPPSVPSDGAPTTTPAGGEIITESCNNLACVSHGVQNKITPCSEETCTRTRATFRPRFGHLTPGPFRDFASARAIAPPGTCASSPLSNRIDHSSTLIAPLSAPPQQCL